MIHFYNILKWGVYTYTLMYIQEQMYTYTCTHRHPCTDKHTHKHPHIDMHSQTCTHPHKYTHRHTHTQYTHAHIDMHTHAHTYMTHTQRHIHMHTYTPRTCPNTVTCWWSTFLLKTTGIGEYSMGHPFLFAFLQEHTVNCTRTPVLTSAVWTAVPVTARAWMAHASVHQGSQVSDPWVCFQTHHIVPTVSEARQPQALCHEQLQSRGAVEKCQETWLQWDLF